jgi:hypothetical protein
MIGGLPMVLADLEGSQRISNCYRAQSTKRVCASRLCARREEAVRNLGQEATAQHDDAVQGWPPCKVGRRAKLESLQRAVAIADTPDPQFDRPQRMAASLRVE